MKITQDNCPYHHMTRVPYSMTERGYMAIVWQSQNKCWRIQSARNLSKPIHFCPFCGARLGGDSNDG